MGVVSVAIGAAGIPALHDRRGESDRDGRLLPVTLVARGDVLATAASLVMGEGSEGVPAAIVRGVTIKGAHRPAADLLRSVAEDLFQ